MGERQIDARQHEGTWQVRESYALIKQIKDELAKELPEGEPDAKKKLAKYYEAIDRRRFSASR